MGVASCGPLVAILAGRFHCMGDDVCIPISFQSGEAITTIEDVVCL